MLVKKSLIGYSTRPIKNAHKAIRMRTTNIKKIKL